jgi:hypothetical protein
MDNGDDDAGVVLGSAGSAMLWLGKSNEETVRMTGRSQHQGRRMGQRCSPGRDEQRRSACSAMMLPAASASGYGSVPHTGRRSQPAWKWCGKVVEHRWETWALLTDSENDELIAMEAATGKKMAFEPGWLLCRKLYDREHHPGKPIGAQHRVTDSLPNGPHRRQFNGFKNKPPNWFAAWENI